MATRPNGMMIYAISEMKADSPYRRFVFANWDETDDATVEIEAQGFTME